MVDPMTAMLASLLCSLALACLCVCCFGEQMQQHYVPAGVIGTTPTRKRDSTRAAGALLAETVEVREAGDGYVSYTESDSTQSEAGDDVITSNGRLSAALPSSATAAAGGGR